MGESAAANTSARPNVTAVNPVLWVPAIADFDALQLDIWLYTAIAAGAAVVTILFVTYCTPYGILVSLLPYYVLDP